VEVHDAVGAHQRPGASHNPVNRLNAASAGLQWNPVSGQKSPVLGLRMGEFSQRIVRPSKDYIEIVAFGYVLSLLAPGRRGWNQEPFTTTPY